MSSHPNVFRVGLVAALFMAGTLQAADKLVIVSPNWEGIRYEFARAFSAWHQENYDTPVEVDWRDLGGSSENVRFVISEFKQSPTGIGADLFFGGGTDPFFEFARRDLLQVYKPAALAGIPAQVGGVPVYDPDYRWFGTSLSSFGILYNQRVLNAEHLPVLRTWRELAEQAPAGRIGCGDPRNSGTMHMMFEMILQRYGWDDGWRLLTLLSAKTREFDRGASTSAKDCTTGNTAYTLAIDFYALTQIAYAGKENLGFILPADCVTLSPDGVAILRGAPHRQLAERFIEFALGEPGQRLLMVPRGQPGGAQRFSIERMSVRPKLYDQLRDVTLVPINPFAQPVTFQYDARKAGARWDLVNGLIGATLIDLHAELAAVFQRTRRVPGKPPVTEAEAMKLAGGEWKDPHYRQRKLIEWQRWAQQQYESLTP
ncbi:MAG: extracellular solute-binding protein [Verrucomicrobiota bacterium]